MPNLPWQKWFFQDWLSDPHLSSCSPATRGIWKDMLSNMVLAGVYEYEVDEVRLARLCRCSPDEVLASIEELISTGTATERQQNGNRFVVSRRLEREHISKQNKINAGKASASRRTEGQQTTQQPSASASVYASASDFDTWWSAYPRKVGRAKAQDAWRKLNPPLDKCLATLAWQKRSEQWRKDKGAYVPHPTTWLNQGRWDDEPETVPEKGAAANPQAKFNGVYHSALSALTHCKENFDEAILRDEYEGLKAKHSDCVEAVEKAWRAVCSAD